MWWAYTRGGGLYSGGLIVGGLRYDKNTDFIIFYIFIDLYSGAGDLSIAASFFQKY